MTTISTSLINTASRKNLLIPAIIPLLGWALATSVPTQANTEAGQFEVSPFVGYQMFQSKQNLENALTYGIRLGYNFTDRWALEGAVSMTGTSVDDASVTDPAKGQFASPIDDVDLSLYQLDALYHFRPQNTFSPYVAFGYGMADYSPSISDKAMSTFNLGIGAKYWLGENLAMRFDLRDHFVSELFDEGYHNLSATVGITFAFGGRSEPRRTPPAEPASAPASTRAPAATAPAPTPRQAPVEQQPTAPNLEEIYFEFDQATLTSDARRLLQRHARTLKDNSETKVRIAGFTSSAGTAEHNKALSERRAVAVKNYLVEQGISARRLTTVGYGDTRPVARETNPSDQNSAAARKNMRVQFEIITE